MRAWLCSALAVCLAVTGSLAASAQDAPPETAPEFVPAPDGMTAARLAELVALIDPEHEAVGASTAFTVAERPLLLVYDESADRMRIVSAIAPTSLLGEDLAYRMLQANFDAVLDVRYAIANDLIWAAFIHPLGSLTDTDFISAVAQVVTAADTFGTTFTSGALVYGGGDSSGLHEELLDELEGLLEDDGI